MDRELTIIGARAANEEVEGDTHNITDIPGGEDAIAEVRPSRPSISLLMQNRLAHDTGEGEAAEENVRKVFTGLALITGVIFTVSFSSVLAFPGGYDKTSGEPIRMGQASVQMDVAFNSVASVLAVIVLLIHVLGSARIMWLKMLIVPCIAATLLFLLAGLLGFLCFVNFITHRRARWILIMMATMMD